MIKGKTFGEDGSERREQNDVCSRRITGANDEDATGETDGQMSMTSRNEAKVLQ